MIQMAPTLASISDAESPWGEFISGVQSTFENNAAMAPVLGIVLLVGVVIIADFMIAKWIVRQSYSGSKRTTRSKRSVTPRRDP